MTRGRPLRFLTLVIGGWTAARVLLLWPQTVGPLSIAEERIALQPQDDREVATPTTAAPLSGDARSDAPPDSVADTRSAAQTLSDDPLQESLQGRAQATPAMIAVTPAQLGSAQQQTSPTPPDHPAMPLATARTPDATPSPRPPPSRLRGDAWLIVRSDDGDSLPFGQLGASQAGIRLTYAIDETRRLALSARASTPLRGAGREAAVGVDWQPTRLPFHLLVEQRVPLDGGTARPAAQAFGGIAHRLPHGLRIDAYAQAGAVHRRGGFADGAARLARPVLAQGIATLDLGVGAWGAAQRRVSRLDLGPTLGLTLPAGSASVRLAVDYRLRVAGRARPGSGPAVSLGTSF